MPYPARDDHFSRRWVMWIALIMAAMAGLINSVIFVAFGLPVSQMTGVATHISDSLYGWHWVELIQALGILFAFVTGAFLSGWLIGHAHYFEDRSYGVAFSLNAIILSVAAAMSWFDHTIAAVWISALACGLQNAMVASYKGLQIRTTHVTGIVTDIGVFLAQRFKHKQRLPWQARLLFAILTGFILGGIMGLALWPHFGLFALVVPALLNLSLSLHYFWYLTRKAPT
ncbi:MAG: YoaK family protein [Hydrogenovibrio sp.]|uniref:YoaK family protein n=1 Tax=Hydrogenovibrio sp. TaxID=2065821 RepID=UPI00287068C3|nr:YoaK family protein [Hydrogenovibrio sp.]MDR9499637.1 YoaK family protein [Hydrogenovibrio sp.]